MIDPQVLDELARRASGFLERARVPYSRRPEAAIILAADGTWIPGVRVESASFSLAIPALLNAVSTAHAAGITDLVVLVTAGRGASATLGAYVRGLPGTWERITGAAWVNREMDIPVLGAMLDPFLEPSSTGPDIEDEIALVRNLAARAFVPESDFRVGCLVRFKDGRALPGVNVEHPDWGNILCAERNALSTAVTWSCPEPERLVLTCLDDPTGTPCGACRQLLAELAPTARVIMDRGVALAETRGVLDLLPGAFTGVGLGK